MADLVTHVALAHVAGRAADARFRATLLVGTVLPDVLYKTGLYLLGGSTWFCEPTHSPLVLVAVAYAGSLLFEPSLRQSSFFALWAGSWLHVLIDAGKSYTGEGVILWAFPFSMERVEFGLYHPQDTFDFILPSLGLVLAVEAVVWALRRRRKPDEAAVTGHPR